MADKHSYEKHYENKVGKWQVRLTDRKDYGYYEHDDEGEGGGLWIKDGELVDYDGRAILPPNVKQALINLGIKVGEDF
jgi:hypothetical protein